MPCICCTISKAHGETTQAIRENSKTFVEAGATKFDGEQRYLSLLVAGWLKLLLEAGFPHSEYCQSVLWGNSTSCQPESMLPSVERLGHLISTAVASCPRLSIGNKWVL